MGRGAGSREDPPDDKGQNARTRRRDPLPRYKRHAALVTEPDVPTNYRAAHVLYRKSLRLMARGAEEKGSRPMRQAIDRRELLKLWRKLVEEFPELRWETVKHVSFTMDSLEQVEQAVTQRERTR